MGIPSYYKKLCDRIPGLLLKQRKGGAKPSHLWIDFNCMVYHCMRRPGARPYTGEESQLEWEAWLIQDVCKYAQTVASIVGPTQQVFVAVDGVVPMAKMRQQRLRRFKSIWVASEERRIGKSEGGPRWDSNAITPGTAFMERLGDALRGIRTPGLRWVISTADEFGEGEHKAMSALRGCGDRQCHVVYGLDADLILLCLLQDVGEMWLFRESVECGEVQYDESNKETYSWFHVQKLKEIICKGQDDQFLLDYCMAMALLGNDFLPHSMTFKIKDGGHDSLIEMLREVRKACGSLIDKGSLTWNQVGLVGCIQWLARREEAWMKRHVETKVKQKNSIARGANPQEIINDEWMKMPLRACDELALVHTVKKEAAGSIIQLHADWRAIYNQRWLHANTQADIDFVCAEFCKGLNWVVQYYMGGKTDTEWCFPWYTPPLWEDVLQWLQGHSCPRDVCIERPMITPQQQLTMVLPKQSWWLIRDKKLRGVMNSAPHFWPDSFPLFTAGRKQTWECEAMIPLLVPERLRLLYVGPKN